MSLHKFVLVPTAPFLQVWKVHSFDAGDLGGETMLPGSMLAVNAGFFCHLPGKCQQNNPLTGT